MAGGCNFGLFAPLKSSNKSVYVNNFNSVEISDFMLNSVYIHLDIQLEGLHNN